jgi:YbgC/YbaW family acyl-CoA thioester hydrolase
MYNYPETVEFEDIDSYGIAHHAKIITYLERARVHFFLDNEIDVKSIDFGLVLVNLNVQFKQPLLLMDKIDIQVTVIKIEKYRFEWEYKIIKNNKICIIANVEQVLIDLKTKKIIQIPDSFKKLLSKILII